MKLRVPVKKDQEDWFGRVMRMLARPYRLVRPLERSTMLTNGMTESDPGH